jgi:hypothetical protein
MQVRLALLADAANVSREGKLNILGVFDTVFSAQFPTVHPQMQLVLRFAAAPPEAGTAHAVDVRFESEDGQALFRVPVTINVPTHALGDTLGVDHIITLHNVRFAAPGRYLFRVGIDGIDALTVPLRAEQVAVRH